MAIIQTLSSSDFKYQKELAYFLITAGVLLTGLAVKTSGYIEGTKDKKIKPLPEKLANNKKRKYGRKQRIFIVSLKLTEKTNTYHDLI